MPAKKSEALVNTLKLSVVALVFLAPAIYTFYLHKAAHRPPIIIQVPSNTGDIVIYERTLFAIGYANGRMIDKLWNPDLYRKYKEEGEKLWEDSKIGVKR